MYTLKSHPPSSAAEAIEGATTSVVAPLIDKLIAEGTLTLPDIHGEGTYHLYAETGAGAPVLSTIRAEWKGQARAPYTRSTYAVSAALGFDFPHSYACDRDAYIRAWAASVIAGIFAGRRLHQIRCGTSVSSLTTAP